MTINDLKINYDGICIYATTKLRPGTAGKFILFLFNIVFIIAIIMFCIEGAGAGAIVFLAAEFFILRYSLWNLYGEERLIINSRSISYQHHYGFFNGPFHTISFNRRITISSYEEVIEGHQTYVKFLFKSYNKNNLPDVIYQSVLHINKTDFEKLLKNFDQLFVDEMVESYEMPKIFMN
jgi:hypothetical protein